MLKGRKTQKGVQLFDPFKNCDYNFSDTTWTIIKTIKKHGMEEAVSKIMSTFNIDEKNAKEDIETVLSNLKTLNLKLEEIPFSVSNVKYAPRTVHFDITGKCNSKCIYCYVTDRLDTSEELSTQQILRVLDELAELDTWTIMVSGGEPFLKKDLLKILKRLEEIGISTSILTNGMFITDNIAKNLASLKNIGMIQISLDSSDPKHHNLHRGIEDAYEKTLKGIKNLKKYGVTPKIEMVVTPYNVNDIENTIEFLYKLGVKSITIGPAMMHAGRGSKNKQKLFFDKELLKSTGKKIMELNKKYKGSMCISPIREFLAYSTDNRVSKEEIKCGVGTSILYISPKGLVYPCLFSIYPKTLLGDIKRESLSEIWKKSKILKKFRDTHVPDIEKCELCDFKYIYDLIIK